MFGIFFDCQHLVFDNLEQVQQIDFLLPEWLLINVLQLDLLVEHTGNMAGSQEILSIVWSVWNHLKSQNLLYGLHTDSVELQHAAQQFYNLYVFFVEIDSGLNEVWAFLSHIENILAFCNKVFGIDLSDFILRDGENSLVDLPSI